MLDEAKVFETQYPESKHLSQVRLVTLENLWMTFGAESCLFPLFVLQMWSRGRKRDSEMIRKITVPT